MQLIQLIVIALVQGLTEFLPISSDAHLILIPRVFGWPDQGLAFDIAGHVGTLAAVVIYFRHEIAAMLHDWWGSITGKGLTPDARLAWAVGFGTIPVGIAGYLFKHFVETDLRSPIVIACATIGFGVLLWAADALGRRQRPEHDMTWKDVAAVGCAQVLALIPGTSRSGITMTAGLGMGLTREGAARFSFLLSIPVIFLAGGLEGVDLLQAPGHQPWGSLLLVAMISLISAYVCIHYFLKFLARVGMLPFVIYRFILGAFLFVYFVA